MQNVNCGQGCRASRASGMVGMQNGTVTSKNSLAVSYKAVQSPYDPAIHHKCLPKRNENFLSPKKPLYANVYRDFITTKSENNPNVLQQVNG